MQTINVRQMFRSSRSANIGDAQTWKLTAKETSGLPSTVSRILSKSLADDPQRQSPMREAFAVAVVETLL